MPEISVAHLTSAHQRNDTRIFLKMCSSLAILGYKVSLVVADEKSDEFKNGVSIFNVGPRSGGRLSRMTKTVAQVLKKAIELDCDIYHLHDPELIPAGLKLKKLGKKVIFDAHEDLPKQLLGKPYLIPPVKIALAKVFELFERWACSKFNMIIAATPSIHNKFLKINPNTVNINNFPLLDELANTSNWMDKENEVVYVGGISKVRGIEEIISAMNYTDKVRLNLVGQFNEKALEEKVKNHKAWSKVNEFGFLNRDQVNDVLAKSKAGLVTFLPLPNHIDSQPNKMFEYMSAGLPIIVSNFPLWREIVDDNQCGLCVDPISTIAIGDSIQYLIEHPKEAEQMGKNGRKAIEEKYNWSIEERKLFEAYRKLLH